MAGEAIGDGANTTVVFLGLPKLEVLLDVMRAPVNEKDGLCWEAPIVVAKVEEEVPVVDEKAPFKRPRISALKSSLSPLLDWSTTQLSSACKNLSARMDCS